MLTRTVRFCIRFVTFLTACCISLSASFRRLLYNAAVSSICCNNSVCGPLTLFALESVSLLAGCGTALRLRPSHSITRACR